MNNDVNGWDRKQAQISDKSDARKSGNTSAPALALTLYHRKATLLERMTLLSKTAKVRSENLGPRQWRLAGSLPGQLHGHIQKLGALAQGLS